MKIKKFKQGDIVLIKWVDSFASGRWYNDTELDSWQKVEVICKSVGYFYKATKKSVILYQNKSDTERGNLTNIPIGAIRKSKLIKKT